MAWVSCIFTSLSSSYSLSHPFSFDYLLHTYEGQMGWTRDLWSICHPSLTTTTPFKSQKILFHDRAMGSNNQKEIKYISHSNIRASVETRPPKLHNLLWFSPFPPPPSIPDNLWTSPIRASRVSAVHVFLVVCSNHRPPRRSMCQMNILIFTWTK